MLGAALAALQAAPAVCDTIYRSRPNGLPVPESVDQAINVQWDHATALPRAIAGAPIDWTTRLTVECYARSVRDSGDLAVDPLLAAVYERLAADSTLGGIVEDLNIVGIEAENTAEGKKTGWVRMTYLVQHQTQDSTLE
jgi:hypothetical protein